MLHSGYRTSAQSAVQYVKSAVRYRGLNTAGGWIRNPLESNLKFAARLYSKYLGETRSDDYKGPFNPVVYINQLERLALESQTGNCSELSAVAFKYLVRANIRPIEYFAVFRGSWNHAFIVLNRDASIPIKDFAKWSYDAVVCDPLYDRSADAGMLAPWYSKMFPLTDDDLMVRLEAA
jgi:hypothetical protein